MLVRQTHRRATTAMVVIAAIIGLGTMAALASRIPINLGQLNIFHLVSAMNGTTAKMLNQTQELHQRVGAVNTKLLQLNTQEKILSHQIQTGTQLQSSLTTQIARTQTDVGLMQTILRTEQISADKTGRIAEENKVLLQDMEKNSRQLLTLHSYLAKSTVESQTMNQQLDVLLQALSSSEQEFKVFGQLESVLSSLPTTRATNGTLTNVLKHAQTSASQTLQSTNSATGNLLP